MDIPGRQVLRYTSALVLVLDAHGLMRSERQARVAPTAHLNAGLLVGAQYVFICPEWLTLPLTCVQIQQRPGQLQEVRVTWVDPRPIPPRTQGVAHQHAPDGTARGRDQFGMLGSELTGDFNGQLTETVATEWYVAIPWTRARQRYDQCAGLGSDAHWPTAARVVL